MPRRRPDAFGECSAALHDRAVERIDPRAPDRRVQLDLGEPSTLSPEALVFEGPFDRLCDCQRLELRKDRLTTVHQLLSSPWQVGDDDRPPARESLPNAAWGAIARGNRDHDV